MSHDIGLPPTRLCIAVTGHRESNIAFAANRAEIEAALAMLFEAADAMSSERVKVFGHHALAVVAVAWRRYDRSRSGGLERGWEIVAPLPFGLDLNIAINADPANDADAAALLGEPGSGRRLTLQNAPAIFAGWLAVACLFELAEEDAKVAQLLMTKCAFIRVMQQGGRRTFTQPGSERVAAAGRVMVEQSDILVAIWDGVTPGGNRRHAAYDFHGGPSRHAGDVDQRTSAIGG